MCLSTIKHYYYYCFCVLWNLHRFSFPLLCNRCSNTEWLTIIIVSFSLMILWVDWAQLCGPSASCDVGGGCILGAWLGWTSKMASLPGWQLVLVLLGTLLELLIDQRASGLLYMASLGDLDFSQHGIWVPRGSISKGKGKSCKSLKAFLQRYTVSLLPNPVGQNESRG